MVRHVRPGHDRPHGLGRNVSREGEHAVETRTLVTMEMGVWEPWALAEVEDVFWKWRSF
jgi:hypothetical protein